jgi:hypothetical protein
MNESCVDTGICKFANCDINEFECDPACSKDARMCFNYLS